MTQTNDWSKSYQHSLGNVKIAAWSDDINELVGQIEETNKTNQKNMMQNTHQLSDALKRVKPDNTPEGMKNPSGIYWPKSQEEFEQLTKRKAPQTNTKYDPEVYKHVRDVPPLKPKEASVKVAMTPDEANNHAEHWSRIAQHHSNLASHFSRMGRNDLADFHDGHMHNAFKAFNHYKNLHEDLKNNPLSNPPKSNPRDL